MTDAMPLGYWFKVLERLSDEHFLAAIDEHGVTLRQWQLLNELRGGAKSLDELDTVIARVTAALAPDAAPESSLDNLTELIESGWVASTAEGYELTDRGIAATERLLNVIQEIENKALIGVDPQTAELLEATLHHIARNLGYGG